MLALEHVSSYKYTYADCTDAFLCDGPDMIDKTTKEIKQDDEKTVYKSLEEIGDDLPDHSPRFVLLSYPMTLVRKFLAESEFSIVGGLRGAMDADD